MSLIVVTALFVTSYLVSNIMAVKVICLFDLLYFDAGTITFPFAYGVIASIRKSKFLERL